MAILKCKMCGGELNFVEGASTAECEFCGSIQTIPKVDDEKKLTLFARANRLRAACEFDKAAGIYEAIVADFPEEAESYWGLVLCKYGIEYVDDPATGKKIPTCHRSSFASVMEDPDFEQALENADATARRVYRDEAKQIEEIRKGIIAVSANEEPYDIFICYKETDEKGQRTLDSVLAQDVYDVLTEKGYRVFFSRITLEDKLGMEYEPYIFAALNSAKIMLAFGTDYEYFSAVWVKNEWSRFLKLMAKDKTKHLIPCYKGIDAYDMPKEFAKLQAQDLGKVGAMQDLLRGIEKILPKEKNTIVIQERVVTGSSADSKLEALLDRGYMALEDGDWAKADGFFEDVLNNDSKNAQAYLGKALAQAKQATLENFIRARKDATRTGQMARACIAVADAHIDGSVRRFSLPGYVTQKQIEDLYSFDLGYSSEVTCRQKQYQEEAAYWENHKLLSRAEKFAVGEHSEKLTKEKNDLFAALSHRIRKAEEAAEAARKHVQAQYEAHLLQADEKAEKLYADGLARKEKDYETWQEQGKSQTNPESLLRLEKLFLELGDYRDSQELAKFCRQKAEEEQAKRKEEAQRQRQLKEKQELAQKAKNKKISMICAVAAVIVIAAIVVMTRVVIPGSNYGEAQALMDAGQYQAAWKAFEALGDYKDSEEKSEAARKAYFYQKGSAQLDAGEYDLAIAAFMSVQDDGYKDIAQKLLQIQRIQNDQALESAYQKAAAELKAGDYDTARELFLELGDYADSAQMVKECTYQEAISMLAYGYNVDYGQIARAREMFLELGDYSDAAAYVDQFRYVHLKFINDENNYSYWYDAHGRQTGHAHFHDLYQYNEDGLMVYSEGVTYEYNELGQKIRATSDQKTYSTVTEYGYDENGDMAWQHHTLDFKSEEMTDAVHDWRYEYEYENGLLMQKTSYQDGKRYCVDYYTYNDDGWLLREVHEDQWGSRSSYTKYTYDENGYVIKQEDRIGYVVYENGYIWAPEA